MDDPRIKELSDEVDRLQKALDRERKKTSHLESELLEANARLRVASVAPQVGQQLINEMLQIARESETAKRAFATQQANLVWIIDELYACHADTVARHIASGKRIKETQKQLQDVQEKFGLNYITTAILNLYLPIEQEATETVETLLAQREKAIEKPISERGAAILINEIVAQTRMSTIWDLAGLLFKLSSYHTGDPRITAVKIIYECDAFDQPSMKTLQNLQSEWIEQHLTSNPFLPTLQRGLAEAWKYRKKNNPPAIHIYARIDGSTSERTLRTYLSWYKIFEEMAKEAPEFADSLPEKAE